METSEEIQKNYTYTPVSNLNIHYFINIFYVFHYFVKPFTCICVGVLEKWKLILYGTKTDPALGRGNGMYSLLHDVLKIKLLYSHQ